jgi:hypothetical protein
MRDANIPRSMREPFLSHWKDSSALSDEQLADFVQRVIRAHYLVRITPIMMRAIDNPPTVVDKHRTAELIEVRDGTNFYVEQGRGEMARFYEEYGNWFQNPSYSHFMKLRVLGLCITRAMTHAIGHSISDRCDRDELPRMRLRLYEDFKDVTWC